MKIAVYAIAKNEEKHVKRFCESAKEADLIIITDTGSEDKTVEIAKECGAITHQINITPFRFDVARNAALSLVPADVDICVSMDLDELLLPGWREEIERCWSENITRLNIGFDFGEPGLRRLGGFLLALHEVAPFESGAAIEAVVLFAGGGTLIVAPAGDLVLFVRSVALADRL